MKNKNFKSKLQLLAMLLSIVFFQSCQDTRPYENVRKIKHGMTIKQVQEFMGEPLTYKYINDSTETRTYVYDNAGNGIDLYLEVTYKNEILVGVENKL